MENHRRIPGTYRLQLLLESRDLGVRGGQEVDERVGMLEPQFRAGDVPRLILQHPAHHLAQVATGEGVVADKSDAARSQIRAADGHELVAHRRRHPGVDPVSDDVVELAEAGVQIHDVELVEGDVLRSNSTASAWAAAIGTPARSTPANRLPGSVSAIGIRLAPLPHPSSSTRHCSTGGRAEPEQSGKGRQVVGMGLARGVAVVKHLIVRIVGCFIVGESNCAPGCFVLEPESRRCHYCSAAH